ncbi:MAG: hypothetical protein LBF63_07400 [Treponema sp.]|nr:hypothetical protein [Treponema sp.]
MDFEDIQDELFRLEYPYLHAGSDPDIERYCYLRAAGQGRAALDIYQYRIKPRYPDDTLRMALLHTYRGRSPLFPRLLAVAYRRLAGRALERVRKLIGYIAEKIRTYNKQDVYSTIKTIEDILCFFPKEQYEAVSGLDRMYRYAQVLNYQVGPMEQAVELVRSYLSRSLPVLERERSRRQDQERKREKGQGEAAVDFSLVVFSSADLARIEIPDRFTRPEDQTLAYCMKYWNLVNDVAFEQILFLYSRKYGKKNHAVYLTIRRGRNANYRDEDILSSVMSMLVTGYYYSIQGDRYLQRNWQFIKNAMDRAAAKPPPGGADQGPQTRRGKNRSGENRRGPACTKSPRPACAKGPRPASKRGAGQGPQTRRGGNCRGPACAKGPGPACAEGPCPAFERGAGQSPKNSAAAAHRGLRIGPAAETFRPGLRSVPGPFFGPPPPCNSQNTGNGPGHLFFAAGKDRGPGVPLPAGSLRRSLYELAGKRGMPATDGTGFQASVS